MIENKRVNPIDQNWYAISQRLGQEEKGSVTHDDGPHIVFYGQILHGSAGRGSSHPQQTIENRRVAPEDASEPSPPLRIVVIEQEVTGDKAIAL
jgi:hypothetical protein